MLAVEALKSLRSDLRAAVTSMGIERRKLGFPELVEKQNLEIEKLFQGYSHAKPNGAESYAAALAFLRGKPLDEWQKHLVASALALPINEQKGAVIFGSNRFNELLASYERDAAKNDLWRLTWHGLLASYFSFSPSAQGDSAALEGWKKLQKFLERTWPFIDNECGQRYVPNWASALRSNSEILGGKPPEKYAAAYLSGDTALVDQIKEDLGIPASSWFWHELVIGAVNLAIRHGDDDYRRFIPQLIKLVKEHPGFRDEAIESILGRYHACQNKNVDERLRDFVIQPTVWKNPKLKQAGIATSWNRVPEPVWRMVLTWVNEQNLADFFEILASRNRADQGRLAFWSKYLKQITWTRLVFGADTMMLKNSNAEVRALIAREEGAYAQLTANRDVDAFMMQIGSFVIIEFSKKPNACYVYKSNELPFEPYSRHYDGGTPDLKKGYYDDCAAKIAHTPGWEERATAELEQLGIRKDRPEAQRTKAQSTNTGTSAQTSGRAKPRSAPGDSILNPLMRRFSGAYVNDTRKTVNSGRLWVVDPQQRQALGDELKALGFEWADSRKAWYYREN